MKLKRSISLVAMAAIFGACSGSDDDPAQAKGTESDVPQDGKFDSFKKPTDHGALCVPSTVGATISESDGMYHAWNLDLTQRSKINVSIAPSSDELDTVMYLYKREGNSWGSYIARDDDGGPGKGSRLYRALDPGTYRYLVKAYRSNMSGSFEVRATGDAVECTATAVCEADAPGEPAPKPGVYNDQCAKVLGAVQSQSRKHIGSYTVTMQQRCDLPDAVNRAMELANQSTSGIYLEEEEELFVSHESIGADHELVQIDDNIGLRHVILSSHGTVLSHYQTDGLSDGTEWFCPAGTPETQPYCTQATFEVMLEPAVATTSVQQTVTIDTAKTLLPAELAFAVEKYSGRHALASSASIDVSGVQWDYRSRVTLKAGGAPAELFLLKDDLLIGIVPEGAATIDFVCEFALD